MQYGGRSLNNYKIGNSTYKAKGASRILKHCRQFSSSEHSVTQVCQQKNKRLYKRNRKKKIIENGNSGFLQTLYNSIGQAMWEDPELDG
jgi:hypothetical protein